MCVRVCVFLKYIFLIYSGVFALIIMEVMSATCVSHPFVIECCDVSGPITWRLISIDWTSPLTILVLFSEQWSGSKFIC